MKTLIVMPDLNGPGGVAHYYKAVLLHITKPIDCLVTGTNYSGGRNFPGPVRLVLDVFAFTRRAWRYDLIHLNPSLCARCFFRELILIVIAKLMRRRVVVFFRGWDKGFEQTVSRKLNWLFKAVYCHVDAMIVLAREFEETVRKWGYKGPVYCETTTVDETLLEGVDPFLRSRSGREWNVLFLARVEKNKGVYDLVDAALQLKDMPVKFVVGGDGGEKEALQQYAAAKKCQNIEFPGYLRGDEKIAAYRSADVFLFPSYHGEGMPNSVLEAMAFGLPVITCPVGGIKDFFEDGKTGFMVPARSSDAIVSSLKRLLNEPSLWAQMSRHNAQYASERFYSSRVAIRLMKIYEEVMKQGGKNECSDITPGGTLGI